MGRTDIADTLGETLPILDEQIRSAERDAAAATGKLRSLRKERELVACVIASMNGDPVVLQRQSRLPRAHSFASGAVAVREVLRLHPGSTPKEIRRFARRGSAGNFPHSLLSNWAKAGKVTVDKGRYTLVEDEKHPLGQNR